MTDSTGLFNDSTEKPRSSLASSSVLYNDQQSSSGSGDTGVVGAAPVAVGTQANDYAEMSQRWGGTTLGGASFEEASLINVITPFPELSSFFPLVGILVAVGSSTYLRRRRASKMSD